MKRTIVVIASVLVVAGCGGSSVESAVKDYLSAIADGDGEKACDHLTGHGKREFLDSVAGQVKDAGEPTCEKAGDVLDDALGKDDIKALKDAVDNGTIKSKVDGDTATATIKVKGDTSNEITLKKVDGDWLIDSGFSG